MLNNLKNIDELNKMIKQEKEELINIIKRFLKGKGISQTFLAEEINEDLKVVNKVLNLALYNKKIIIKILLYFKIRIVDSIAILLKIGIGLSPFDINERMWLELLSKTQEVDLETIRSL